MNNNAISKINSMGKATSIITKIMFVCVIVAAVIAFLGTIFFVVMPRDFISVEVNGEAKVDVDTSAVKYNLNDKDIDKINEEADKGDFELNNTEYKTVSVKADKNGIHLVGKADRIYVNGTDFAFLLGMATMLCVASAVLFKFVNNLCKTLRYCETPFTEEIAQNIRKIAICLIPWGVINCLVKNYAESFFASNHTVTIGIDLGMVVVILIVFALAYVFKYGAMLQKESDETL